MMRSRCHAACLLILLTTDVCYNGLTWVCSRHFSLGVSCRRSSLNLPRHRCITRKESLEGSFPLVWASEINSNNSGGEHTFRKVQENVIRSNHILTSIMSDLVVQRDEMSAFLEEIGASTPSSSEVRENAIRANNLLANIMDDLDSSRDEESALTKEIDVPTSRDEVAAFAKETDVQATPSTEVSGYMKPTPSDMSSDWVSAFMLMDTNSDNSIDCKEAFAAGMSFEDFELLSNNGESIDLRGWLSAECDFKRAAVAYFGGVHKATRWERIDEPYDKLRTSDVPDAAKYGALKAHSRSCLGSAKPPKKQYQGPPNMRQSADALSSAQRGAGQREYRGAKQISGEPRYNTHAPTVQKRTSDWSLDGGADALASRKMVLADERQRQFEVLEKRMKDSFMQAATVLQKDGRLNAEIAEIIEEQSEHPDGHFDDNLTRS